MQPTAALSLFTAEGLIRAAVRGEQRGIIDVPSMVHEAHMRWLVLNGMSSPIDSDTDDSWLFRELLDLNLGFHADRQFVAPLLAARHLGDLSTRRKHVGAEIAFVAPVGLFAYRDPEYAFALGVDVARLIHAHPSVYLSAGVLACVIAQLVSGREVVDALALARKALAGAADSAPVLDEIDLLLGSMDPRLEAEPQAAGRRQPGPPLMRALARIASGGGATESVRRPRGQTGVLVCALAGAMGDKVIPVPQGLLGRAALRLGRDLLAASSSLSNDLETLSALYSTGARRCA